MGAEQQHQPNRQMQSPARNQRQAEGDHGRHRAAQPELLLQHVPQPAFAFDHCEKAQVLLGNIHQECRRLRNQPVHLGDTSLFGPCPVVSAHQQPGDGFLFLRNAVP